MEEPKAKRHRTTAAAGPPDTQQHAQPPSSHENLKQLVEKFGSTFQLRSLLVEAAMRDAALAEEIEFLYYDEHGSSQAYLPSDVKEYYTFIIAIIGPCAKLRDILVKAATRDSALAQGLEALHRHRTQSPVRSQQTKLQEGRHETDNLDVSSPSRDEQAISEPSRAQDAGPLTGTDGKTFDAELEMIEVWLGYTGRYADYDDDEEKNADFRVSYDLYKMMQKWVNEIPKPETTWTTKRNTFCAILHVMMTVLEAPPGWVARYRRQDSFDFGDALMKVLGALTTEERAKLGTDKELVLDMVEVNAEAKSYSLGDYMKMDEAKTLLNAAVSSLANDTDHSTAGLNDLWWPASPAEIQAAEQKRQTYTVTFNSGRPQQVPPPKKPVPPLSRAPWYPLGPNKIIVPEVVPRPHLSNTNVGEEESYIDVTTQLRHVLDHYNAHTKLKSEEDVASFVDDFVEGLPKIAAALLEEATEPNAAWRTVANAASALLDMCDLLAPRGGFEINSRVIWVDVAEKLTVSPICVDQYLMRLVEYLSPHQRFKLSGEMVEGEQTSVLQELEKLMRRTRRKRAMRALETVRDLLLAAREEYLGA